MTPKCPDCKRDQDECVCVDLEAENASLKEQLAQLEAEFASYKRSTDLAYKGSELEAQDQLTTLQSKSAALVDALEAAYNGLRWWMDSFPLNVTEADNEEMLKLVEALAEFKGEK